MLIPRRKYDELQKSLLDKENRLEKLRGVLQDKAIEIRQLRREIERLRTENRTLEVQLDATVAALDQTKNIGEGQKAAFKRKEALRSGHQEHSEALQEDGAGEALL